MNNQEEFSESMAQSQAAIDRSFQRTVAILKEMNEKVEHIISERDRAQRDRASGSLIALLVVAGLVIIAVVVPWMLL